MVKLKHIFEAVRVLALRKIQKNRTTDPIRLLLLGFEDLDGTDVELLRSTLMSGDSNLMQFRLGLLVLDADRSLFFTKYKKAGGKEGEAELQSWRQRHQRIIAKFLESEVLVLARMRMIKHIVDDVHVHMFGRVVRRVVREQTESGVDKEDMETPSSVDCGVQTCAADGRSVVAEKSDRVLSITGGGKLPSPVLRRHTQRVTYAGRAANLSLAAGDEYDARPPELTHQQVERDAYHKFVGWLSVLGIESGHPDDWDRTFSNAYLFGKILASYDTRFRLSEMKTGYGTASKSRNWIMLTHGLMDESRGATMVTEEMCDNASKAYPGASVAILKVLYDRLQGNKIKQRPPANKRRSKSGGVGRGGAVMSASTRNPMNHGGSLWEQEQQNMLRRTERLHS